MHITTNQAHTSRSASAYLVMTLCMLLVLGQSAGSWLSHRALANVEQTLPNGIELICTGSSIRFVSLPASIEAGEMVFVSAPEAQQNIADFWCQTAQGIFDDDAFDYGLGSLSASLLGHVKTLSVKPASIVASPHYPSAQPRSPPVFA